jgi:hypothetical protein
MKEKIEKKKYERTVQSLNRNPCLPGILSCYIVPFMLLIHPILFFFLSKKKKGEQTIEEGTAACLCRFLHSMQSLNPNISCFCWRKGKQKKKNCAVA